MQGLFGRVCHPVVIAKSFFGFTLVFTLIAFVWRFFGMGHQMILQSVNFIGSKLAHPTLKTQHVRVCHLVVPKMVIVKSAIIALIALKRFLLEMCPYMSSKMRFPLALVVADSALERFLGIMNDLMLFQYMDCRKSLVALGALVRFFFIVMLQFVASQVVKGWKTRVTDVAA